MVSLKKAKTANPSLQKSKVRSKTNRIKSNRKSPVKMNKLKKDKESEQNDAAPQDQDSEGQELADADAIEVDNLSAEEREELQQLLNRLNDDPSLLCAKSTASRSTTSSTTVTTTGILKCAHCYRLLALWFSSAHSCC